MVAHHAHDGKHDIEGGRVEELDGLLLEAMVFCEVYYFMVSRFFRL